MAVVYPFAAKLISEGMGSGNIVLDVGCAGRQYERHIQSIYEGVDIAVSDVNNPPTYVTSAASLPCEDSRFDLAFGIGTFSVIPQVDDVFSEMRRVLKVGGRLLVIDYQQHVGQRLLRAGHASSWTYESLAEQLLKAGFSEVKNRSEKAYSRSVLQACARYVPQLLTLVGRPPVWLIVEAKK